MVVAPVTGSDVLVGLTDDVRDTLGDALALRDALGDALALVDGLALVGYP